METNHRNWHITSYRALPPPPALPHKVEPPSAEADVVFEIREPVRRAGGGGGGRLWLHYDALVINTPLLDTLPVRHSTAGEQS